MFLTEKKAGNECMHQKVILINSFQVYCNTKFGFYGRRNLKDCSKNYTNKKVVTIPRKV